MNRLHRRARIQLGRKKRKPNRFNMTLCLAALAQNYIVLVADTMISVDYFEYDAAISKVALLPSGAASLMAGDMSLHSELLNAIRFYVQPSEIEINAVPIDTLANRYNELVNEIYYEKESANLLHRQYGLTSETRLTAEIAPERAKEIAEKLNAIPPPRISTLLVGFDERNRPHIYKYDRGQLTHENLNNWATIGGGWELADHRLFELGHSSGATLSDALFHCYDAKRYSETTSGVGQTTRLFWMDETSFHAPHPLCDLEAIYQKTKEEQKGLVSRTKIEWYETLKRNKDI